MKTICSLTTVATPSVLNSIRFARSVQPPYPRLYEALASVGYGETKTIKLLEDIDYNTGIVITGRTIIFDMNGHTLTVVSSTENGLEVGSGGIVDVTGSGAFNVVSTADNMYGVYAHDGGQASVTSATATVDSYAPDVGFYVPGAGAYATGAGSLVEVIGDAISTGRNGSGVLAFYAGTIRVGGNVTASGTRAVGVYTYGRGTVTIDGTITAPVYIRLSFYDRTASNGIPGTGENEGYLVYAYGGNIVRVKIKRAVIDPSSASYDKHSALDISVAMTLNGNMLSSIKNGEAALTQGTDYTVSGSIVTIKKEYLDQQAVGTTILTFDFSAGANQTLTITVSDSYPQQSLTDLGSGISVSGSIYENASFFGYTARTGQ